MVGRSAGRPAWVLLGLAGCLLHVWNHALFKSLLFFGAGSVAHGAGTRDLERTGGLARRMPVTAALFLLGAVAICGLPPLIGFVSELLVYLGLVRAAVTPGSAWAALPVPLLAATGGLAIACFVKVCGVVFLGTPRSTGAARAHESPPLMLAPMAVLALFCVALGVAPLLAAPALERATVAWAGEPLDWVSLDRVSLDGASLGRFSLDGLAPLGWVSVAAVALLATIALLVALVAGVCRRARRRQPDLPTWDCGYAAASPRLQYTASSFAQLITARFAWALRPQVRSPRIAGPFPAPSRFHSHVGDTVLDGLLLPAARGALRLTVALRALPAGQLQRYIVYILAVLVPLLAWALAGGGNGR
jgi:hydrogenase-4 component B